MTGLIIWIVLIAAAVALLLAIVYGKMGGGGGNFAATSVFSDMQNEDKRNAMETIIEEKAGNVRHEDESGEEKNRQSNDTENKGSRKRETEQ